MKNTSPNQLIHETSPYLLQHAYNPVSWYPWGEKALKKAVADDRLLVISIGYSACHWCHVMEKESFEDQDIAMLMNKDYVAVKIDKEERPDLDQVYMQAAYLITGSGGWPLNIIALPDGRPVYAGTYFRKSKWKEILEYFAKLYKEQPDLIIKQAENISEEMLQTELRHPPEEEKTYTKTDVLQIYSGIISKIDPENGGTYGAPKFPMPVIHEYLLHYHLLSNDIKPLNLANTTLKIMAAGGIYDQLGGGFCRYSTDAEWRVPHFEKMLYDNAQLLSLYSKAFQLSRDDEYETIIRETISFIEEMLTSQEGGFYSSLDADSEGEEGHYYIWQKQDIADVAKDMTREFCQYYHVSEEGNWESGKNILYRKPGNTDISSDLMSFLQFNKRFYPIKKELLNIRRKRIQPGLDDKILTSWNALMISGYLDAYHSLGDREFLEKALKNARFLESNIISEDGKLYRNYKNSQASINGFLDDYAFLSDAYINLYQSTFDEHWLYLSRKITDYAIQNFYDPKNKQFFYTSSLDPKLIVRPVETTDNVIPAASSRMVGNLLMLSRYFDDVTYLLIAEDVMASVKQQILKSAAFFSGWASQILSHYYPNIDIVILGPRALILQKEISRHYLPGILLAGAKKRGTLSLFEYKYIEGKTLIYVCIDKSCKQPVESVEEAMDILNDYLTHMKILL